MYWNYLPDLPPEQAFKLYSTGEARAGSKSVVTSDAANNKVVSRSWSKVNDVRLVEMPGASQGIINIGSVEVYVETEANGFDAGSISRISWRLNDFTVYGFSTVAVVDSADDIPDISTLPVDHITRQVLIDDNDSITVGDVSDTIDGNSVQSSVTALEVKINSVTFDQGSWTITVPASTVTLGTVSANVSYANL